MQYMMLIFESPEALESRDKPTGETYLAAWRAYKKTLVQAGVYVTGAPLNWKGTTNE